jgi:hypothetical protein
MVRLILAATRLAYSGIMAVGEDAEKSLTAVATFLAVSCRWTTPPLPQRHAAYVELSAQRKLRVHRGEAPRRRRPDNAVTGADIALLTAPTTRRNRNGSCSPDKLKSKDLAC